MLTTLNTDRETAPPETPVVPCQMAPLSRSTVRKSDRSLEASGPWVDFAIQRELQQ